jgi:hypothetical protein
MWFGADTGGQLWRFDIANGESLANLVTGGVIADLGVAGGTLTASPTTGASMRRRVSPWSSGPDGPELALAIGSGLPRFAAVGAGRQPHVHDPSAGGILGAGELHGSDDVADLYDATANTLATAVGDALETEEDLLYNSAGLVLRSRA